MLDEAPIAFPIGTAGLNQEGREMIAHDRVEVGLLRFVPVVTALAEGWRRRPGGAEGVGGATIAAGTAGTMPVPGANQTLPWKDRALARPGLPTGTAGPASNRFLF